MKHIPPDDVLQLGLGLLKSIGERMHYTSIPLNIFRAFNLGILLTNLFFMVSNLAHIKGSEYITTTEGAITMCHVSKTVKSTRNIKRNYYISRPFSNILYLYITKATSSNC